MQKAMHPKLNYISCFQKKWLPLKMVPFKTVPIKKWLRGFKQKRKEENRLQRAEVHAAISMAWIAAALAAIAAENAKIDDSSITKEAVVASAAVLVAAQCTKVYEGMRAKRVQLSSVISSAMSGTNASDISILSAVATTSLKGAATFKERSRCKNRLNSSTPVMPIEDNITDHDFDFEKCRSLLAKGTELGIETSDGKYIMRLVFIILNSDSKVILKLKKLNQLKSKKERVILDLHAKLYKDSDADVQETEY